MDRFRVDLPHIKDTTALIKEKAVASKVLFVPGRSFNALGGDSRYVRAAFSTATPAMMEEAMQRFGQLLRNA